MATTTDDPTAHDDAGTCSDSTTTGARLNRSGHLMVAAAGWLARIVSIGCQLVNTRVLSSYLESELYAAYAVLLGLVGWFALADLGIPARLQNAISEKLAENRSAAEVILTGAVLLSVTGLLTCAAWLFAAPSVSGAVFHGIGGLGEEPTALAFSLFAVVATATAVANGIHRVWFGERRGYLTHVTTAAGHLIGTTAVLVAARLGGGTNPLLVAILCTQVPLAVVPMIALSRRLTFLVLRPGVRTTLTQALRLLRDAMPFWLFQAAAVVVLNIDYIVLSWTLSADDIVTYHLGSRVFLTGFMFYNAVLLAVWPVCAEALYRNDWAGVSHLLLKYSLIGESLLLCGTGVLVLTSDEVGALLMPGQDVVLSVPLITAFSVYIGLRIWTDTWAMALMAMNRMKVFAIAVPLQAAASIGFQYIGASEWGLVGLVAGLAVSFVATVAWILPWAFLRLRRENERRAPSASQPAHSLPVEVP